MNPIRLHTDMPRNITMIPNVFLDHYMAGANGEFLKIYLYLLRWAGYPGAEITTCSIADFFNMTENDVLRALRFWEQEGLLGIARDDDGNITDICLKPVTAPYSDMPTDKYPNAVKDNRSPKKKAAADIPSYSAHDLQAFVEHDGGEQLFFIIQQYTGKPLNQSDMNTVLFFYEELGMSQDLIEHLFEYCVSNGHRKMNYIQAVAIGWTEAGITTVEEAKAYCTSFSQLNAAVINAFGIKGRYLTEDELNFIRHWNQELHFSKDLIVEACRRTIMTAHSPSFRYADSILQRWYDNQATTLADVVRLDKAREIAKANDTNAASEPRTAKTAAARKPASRFHNFPQRTYDYSKMDVELVQKRHARNQQ